MGFAMVSARFAMGPYRPTVGPLVGWFLWARGLLPWGGLVATVGPWVGLPWARGLGCYRGPAVGPLWFGCQLVGPWVGPWVGRPIAGPWVGSVGVVWVRSIPVGRMVGFVGLTAMGTSAHIARGPDRGPAVDRCRSTPNRPIGVGRPVETAIETADYGSDKGYYVN